MAEPAPPLPAAPTRMARAWALRGIGGRTILGLALVVVLVAVADRSRLRLDLSDDRRFTIDPALAALLQREQDDTVLTGIWTAADEEHLAGLSVQLQQLVAASPHLSYRHIDPELERGELERFAASHEQASLPGLYLSRRSQTVRLPLTGRLLIALQPELGGALAILDDPHPPQVVLLQGHGELHPGGGPNDGGDELAHTITLSGCVVSWRETGSLATISSSALLVLPGPTAPAIGEDVLRLVRNHLHDGGRLLAFLDDRAPTDLCGMLRERGVLVGTLPEALVQHDLPHVIDPQAPGMPPLVVMSMAHNYVTHAGQFPYENLVLSDAGGVAMINAASPATATVAQAGTEILSPRTTEVLALTREELARVDPDLARRWTTGPDVAQWLLSTAPQDAWRQPFGRALMQPTAVEHLPPLHLACWCEYAPTADSAQQGMPARMVVWGSRNAVSDGILGLPGFGNAELVRALVAALTNRTAPTGIAALRLRGYQADISAHGLWLLLAGLVVALPCCMLGAAMLTWWDRR